LSTDIPIWRIKYLPSKLKEICGKKKCIERLEEIIKEKNFPHLLFVGAEGIGKTLIARLFTKEFLGENHDTNTKLVYADVPLTEEERKLAKSEAYVSTSKIGSMAGKKITTPAFIQVKVKPFVQLKVLGGAPFKILIVKNFDVLGDNQQGFRRLMETYGSNCRMILITTRISRIIDPIISRCQIFLISQSDFVSFSHLLKTIANKESLELTDEVIEILYRISDGKIAKAIDLLQLCCISGNIISSNSLYEFVNTFKNDQIRKLIEICFEGAFSKARTLMRDIIKDYKFNTRQFFSHLMDELINLPLSRFELIKLINIIADADFRAIDGRDGDIQISSLLSKLCLFSEKM